jgi:glutamate synthase (NADPH/NADH) small chain
MAKKERLKVRQQAANERIRNFEEVPFGYDDNEAKLEASRCLQCKNPTCIQGCPVNINIKEFISQIASGDVAGAIKTIKESNSLPAVCGRVCPQETQCEEKCVLLKTGQAINIGALERYAADWEAANMETKAQVITPVLGRDGKQIKVAIAGSGPAGLTVAGELAKLGYKAVIFEALHLPGGVLVYGIPEFRLPKAIVKREVDYLKTLGVEIQTDVLVGKSYTIDDLVQDGFQAVFIGVGAGTPSFMNVPGENFKGVYSSNEFLTRMNLLKAYKFPEYDTPVKLGKKVAVVGAGNVAMDSARVSRRLKGVEEVHIIYRRSEKEMPARHEEIEHAKEEGIILDLLTNPVEIISDENGFVSKIKCVRMELCEPDASGRCGTKAIPGSEFIMEVDNVIPALGTKANELLTTNVKGLKLNKWGYIEANPETGATSIPGIFAGGDISTGSATVIAAMGAGKKAAAAIDIYLKAK